MHLVFPEAARDVYEALSALEGIELTGWDHSVDTAAQWSVSGRGEAPDLFFVSGLAGCSTIDHQTGTSLSKEQSLVRRLKEIRISRPPSRIILVLPQTAAENRRFMQDLVALGVYDVYCTSEFSEEDVERWFKTTKGIADMEEFLPGLGQEEPGRASKAADISFSKKPEKKAARRPFDALFKRIEQARKDHFLKSGSNGRAGPSPELPSVINAEQKEHPVQPSQNSPAEEETKTRPDLALTANDGQKEAPAQPTIYALGLNIPSALNFENWENILTAVNTVPPDILVIQAGTTQAEEIKKLRRNKKLLDVPIAVIGGDESVYLPAGVDECFPEWNEKALALLLKRRARLLSLWDSASQDAGRDQLTGLPGRGFLEEYLKEQIALYREGKGPFSLLIMDLDHFKTINDTYGHQAGDEVLRNFAAFLRQNLRETDVVVRYGGEEFIAVWPRTEKRTALSLAQELCRGWQEKGFYSSTFSGGIAEIGLDAANAADLIKAADEALYRAKANGRNQVLAAEAPAQHPVQLDLSPKITQTTVLVIAGAARRVGCTCFALTLAKQISKTRPVEVIDAGGGAAEWLKRDTGFLVRKAPPYSISPGIITIIDAGTEIPAEIQPFASAVFVVTDLSREAIKLGAFSKAPDVFLVGMRGASMAALREIAALWNVNVLCCLPEDQGIKKNEIDGTINIPKAWEKQLKKLEV